MCCPKISLRKSTDKKSNNSSYWYLKKSKRIHCLLIYRLLMLGNFYLSKLIHLLKGIYYEKFQFFNDLISFYKQQKHLKLIFGHKFMFFGVRKTIYVKKTPNCWDITNVPCRYLATPPGHLATKAELQKVWSAGYDVWSNNSKCLVVD